MRRLSGIRVSPVPAAPPPATAPLISTPPSPSLSLSSPHTRPSPAKSFPRTHQGSKNAYTVTYDPEGDDDRPASLDPASPCNELGSVSSPELHPQAQNQIIPLMVSLKAPVSGSQGISLSTISSEAPSLPGPTTPPPLSPMGPSASIRPAAW